MARRSHTLDVFSVHQGQIHTENIKKQEGQREGWWSKYRERQERKLSIALGAMPDKEPIKEPALPRMALGRAAARPVEETFGQTSSSREFDLECASSELRDWMRETGYFQRRPFHKKGMP